MLGCQSDSALTNTVADPVADITSHVNGVMVAQDNVEYFRGAVSDANDGPQDLIATWRIDGHIACPPAAPSANGITTCDIFISENAKQVTLEVRDLSDATSSDSINLRMIADAVVSPLIEIISPVDGKWYLKGDIIFEVTVTDTDDDPTDLDLKWDIDGTIYDTPDPDKNGNAAFTLSSLSAGLHQTLVTVTNTDGLRSSDLISFYVDDDSCSGNKAKDECGVCDDDPTNDCEQDCNGVWGGAATLDYCLVCDDDPKNDCVQDCSGVWGGQAVEDNCGVCDTNPNNDCIEDCEGVWGGQATQDSCGVCDDNPDNDCACQDLNCDGYADIIFSNHLYNGSTEIPSYIYYGSATGYDSGNQTQLDTLGAYRSATADLNDDGFIDIVFANHRDSEEDNNHNIDSYIYWGSNVGHTDENRTPIPTQGARDISIADLNDDTYPDLVISNGSNGTSTAISSFIYWGGPSGYDPANRTELPTNGARGNAVYDLDNDGYLDIVFANHENNGAHNIDSYIYWGSETGHASDLYTGLPTQGAHEVVIHDLDEDGYPEVIFSNFYNGSYNIDSYIYWGSEAGYSSDNRTDLPNNGPLGLSVADLDADCYPDILFSNHMTSPSLIYWGSEAGYDPNEFTQLSTFMAAENAIFDLNSDGFADLIFADYYTATSKIFWGSQTGYSTSNHVDLYTPGSYGVTVVGEHATDAEECSNSQ